MDEQNSLEGVLSVAEEVLPELLRRAASLHPSGAARQELADYAESCEQIQEATAEEQIEGAMYAAREAGERLPSGEARDAAGMAQRAAFYATVSLGNAWSGVDAIGPGEWEPRTPEEARLGRPQVREAESATGRSL